MTTRTQIVRRPGAGAPRRRGLWVDTGISQSVVSAAPQVVRLSGASLDTQEGTLVRTIICLDIFPVTLIGESLDLVETAVGIGTCSEEAFLIGETALPDPENDASFPQEGWIYRCRWSIFEGMGLIMPVHRVNQPLKAQRKLGRGLVYAKFTVDPLAGIPFTVRYFGLIRQYYLLP